MDDELSLVLVLDQASTDELLHHVCGQLPGLVRLLELLDLLLQDSDLDLFLGRVLLLLELRLLVGLDLGHGAAPLAGGLQHFRGDALADWIETEVSLEESRGDTYERCGCWQRTSEP